MAKSLISKTKSLVSKAGKVVSGKDRLTSESDVRSNLLAADLYASRYAELKEANGYRSSKQVRNEIDDYYETLSPDEKKEFGTSYDRTVKSFNTFVKHNKSCLIGIDPDVLKHDVTRHFERNGYGDVNEKAFDLMSVKLREQQMALYENRYNHNLTKANENVNNYASEGILRNFANLGHNIKEKALAGLGNYNAVAIAEKAVGVHQEFKPELKESISSEDLLNKFETIKNSSIDSFGEKFNDYDKGIDY